MFSGVMKIQILTAVTIATLSFTLSPQASAHCQVPCGIYSDDTVLKDLHTHQKTIAKAMQQINELSKTPDKNANQIARWVVNKEEHASKIQHTMNQYFLAQRIKLDEKEKNQSSYLKKLTLAHEIIVLSMKCKQGTDSANADKLLAAIEQFSAAYTAK